VTLAVAAVGEWRSAMIKTTNEIEAPRAGVMGRDSQMPKGVNGAGPASEPAAPRNFIRMLRLSQVVERTGLGKTTLCELQKEGRFPRSAHLTGHDRVKYERHRCGVVRAKFCATGKPWYEPIR
jgi:predicted DNA-binding transcriptional regulator AlpA